MSRPSTSATHIKAVPRIELSYLLKKKYLVKGTITEGSLSWTPSGCSMRVLSKYTHKEAYIRLVYTLTTAYEGTKHEYDYKIHITFVDSNLGKGKVPYFVCPVSGKKCRILYRAYGYHKWKSRNAYQNYLYYPTQLRCSNDYHTTRFHRLNDFLTVWGRRKGKKDYYNGKPTKARKRLDWLLEQKNHHEMLMWHPDFMPKRMKALLWDKCGGAMVW